MVLLWQRQLKGLGSSACTALNSSPDYSTWTTEAGFVAAMHEVIAFYCGNAALDSHRKG